MSHITYYPSPQFAFPRGFIRAIAVEIEWIVSLTYIGEGLLSGHLIAPFAETDFYWQFDEFFIPASTQSRPFNKVLLEAYYWNTVYLDYRDLPTTVFMRASEDVEGYEIVIREPDYAVADALRYTLPAMPSTYWVVP